MLLSIMSHLICLEVAKVEQFSLKSGQNVSKFYNLCNLCSKRNTCKELSCVSDEMFCSQCHACHEITGGHGPRVQCTGLPMPSHLHLHLLHQLPTSQGGVTTVVDMCNQTETSVLSTCQLQTLVTKLTCVCQTCVTRLTYVFQSHVICRQV